MYPGITAQQHPNKIAVVIADSGRLITYRELDDSSAALARAFRNAGLGRGDSVALLTTNTLEALVVYWATRRVGLYVTAVNRHLRSEEIAYIVDDSEARAFIVAADLADLAATASERSKNLELRLAFGGQVDGFGSYEEAITTEGDALTDQPCGAMMLYSSGTTGFPKGIKPPLPDRQVDEPGEPLYVLLDKFFNLSSDDVYLTTAPIYHAAPLGWSAGLLAIGATVVIAPGFDAEQALGFIEKYRITATQMVPTMFVRLLKLPEPVRKRFDISSLRVLVHAAAPCPIDVKRAMIDWVGPILFEYYSATEANGFTFISTPEWLERPGSVGRSVMGVAHICDDAGTELPARDVGTIYFERDVLPFEYHRAPEKTAAAQHPAHPTWTAVGDVGYLDEDGYLFLTDRKTFMIISGGVNIYPQEIEDALALHPKVFDVAVIGVPDEEMGEQVKAVVVVEPGTVADTATADELIAYARDRVAHYKAPKNVDFVEELPRTPTGKLQKNRLRSQYWP
ncbi:acyl-CoA synthetase [Gordonia sp. TBRC 11910]|uniref:Acyl-CoA synthetase n=1 Tax=Gordonia asplenii TaxID=2725283 RepID=A0A848KTV1_9ACTN|nr:acyl-CoA synthetase [Gordonia asplenii]NMO01427.1 acyl-CoA synthetase [Gordonia asplenii]